MRRRHAGCQTRNAECEVQNAHRQTALGIGQFKRFVLCAALAIALTVVHATAAGARDFMWKVTGKTGTVYLIGSVHLLTKDFYPLSPAFDQAFKESNLLVEEADLAELLSPQAQMQLLSRGMLPSSQSLDTVVSPATFALVSRRVTSGWARSTS